VALLPGGSVGAVRPLEAVAQLNTIREAMAAHGGLIVGVDLLREPAAHVRAYDDAAGAMARFNRHILARLNREIDATFELDHFAHRAAWNAERQRVEMSLVSTRTQSPTVAGIGVALGAGEDILTAVSHKYTLEGFASLARIAGWISRAAWVNDEQSFALAYLEAE
jgi:uncharacterized SAM-dependent methyltransferase